MPIVYSAVASERSIVSNFASCDGNFTEIAEQVLSKLPACNNKMTYSHGTYLLHYIAEDDYLYFCITDKLCQRSRAFLFLNEIQRRFITSKQTDDFTTTLASEMYRYSEDYNTIVIRKGELDELNKIGVGCSESLLGEKILYINNPDTISYSTISHVTASPGLVSVSGVCPTPEELSVAKPTTEAISVINPSAERISVARTTLEGVSEENTTEESMLIPGATSEEIHIVDPTQNISIVGYFPDTAEKSLSVGLSPEQISEEILERMSPKSDGISAVCPNQERISTEITISESLPVMSPILYIVIVGMMILVIAMSVYALGPISCVVVTGIGIYSLLRSYKSTKDKAE